MKKTLTIQERVLSELWDVGTKATVEQISKDTELTKRQVHNALTDLSNRNLIITTKKYSKARQKVPPNATIHVELNEKSLKRIKQLIK